MTTTGAQAPGHAAWNVPRTGPASGLGPRPAPPAATDAGDSVLVDYLRRISIAGRCAFTLRGLGLLTAVVLTTFLVAVFADASFAFPAPVRALLRLAGAAAVCAAVVGWGLRLFAQRFDARRMARLAEQRLGRTDSLLINALEFRSSAVRGDSPVLRERVIRMGDADVQYRSALEVVSFRPVLRGALTALAAAGVFGAAWLSAPKLFAMVIPRWVDPYGDHPPYTLLEFDVAITPEPVRHSKPAKIRVRIDGPEIVDEASIVFLDPEQSVDLGAPLGAHDGAAAASAPGSAEQGGTSAAAGTRDSDLLPHPMLRTTDHDFELQIARAGASRRFYVDTPRGRSRPYNFSVNPTPLIESARARLEFLEYTKWPPHEQVLDRRGLRALVGTEVVIRLSSNLPLQAARLRLFPEVPSKKAGTAAARAVSENGNSPPQGDASAAKSAATAISAAGAADGDGPALVAEHLFPASVDNPRTVEGRFSVVSSGRFELQIMTREGIEALEPLSGSIIAVPDQPPRVAILSPEASLIAVEGWKAPVIVEAADDVGVADMQLYRGVNGWGPLTVELGMSSESPKIARGAYEFDLGALGAKAGDVISYYAAARDVSPGGGQTADSQVHTIQVISEEEYKEFARQQHPIDELVEEFEELRKELEQLAKDREELLKQLAKLEQQRAEQAQRQSQGSPPSNEQREQLETLRRQLERSLENFSKQTDELHKQLERRAEQLELYEVEQEYTDELERLAKQLERQSQNAEALEQASRGMPESGAPPSPEQQAAFEEASETFQRESEPFDGESLDRQQATADDLETLKLANQMLAQTDRLRAVITQQRDLANRMAEMAGRDRLTPEQQSRADRFAKEQELLEQELRDLQSDLDRAASEGEQRLPKMSASARQLCESISEQGISQDQQNAAAEAREGQGNEAQQSAEHAARKLEALQAEAGQCEQCQGLQESLDGPLSLSTSRLGQCLKQMSQGRQVPGLGQRGQKPGSGQGPGMTGSGSAPGQGDNEGQPGMWRPGQTFPGSQARSQVMGPRHEAPEDDRPSQSRTPSDGRGQFLTADPNDPNSTAEDLSPETRENASGSSGALNGVPVGYRDAAEAYFRRLNEEPPTP